MDGAGSDGELWFGGGGGLGDGLVGGGSGVGVDEGYSVGVFGLGGAGEAPDWCGGEVGGFGVVDGDGVVGEDD